MGPILNGLYLSQLLSWRLVFLHIVYEFSWLHTVEDDKLFLKFSHSFDYFKKCEMVHCVQGCIHNKPNHF